MTRYIYQAANTSDADCASVQKAAFGDGGIVCTPIQSTMPNRPKAALSQLASMMLAATLLGTLSPMHPALATATADVPTDLADRVTALLPSVATIKTKATTPQGTTVFHGSGFVVDPSGLLITNRHVIEGAFEIRVSFPGMPPLIAEPAFISERLDLAILKVNAGRPLPAVKLGDSSTVRVGDQVFLIGNALGLRTALSTGVISALNANLGDTMYDHYFQTDGALNHGNSGGPMFNAKGEVIAIDTGLISSPGNTGSVGIGFSMPINDAKFVYEQVIKTGRVSVGFVGLRGQRVTDELAEALGLKSADGAIVTEVDPGGTAFGKIFQGDVVLRVNDQDASDMSAVARLVATAKEGTSIDVHLLRGGEEKMVTVSVKQVTVDEKQALKVLGRAPADSIPVATPSKPGMSLTALTAKEQTQYGLQPDLKGVVVTDVDQRSAASGQQISAGDLIELVGYRSVAQPSDVQAALQEAVGQHKATVALLIRGAQGPRWVTLPLEADR